MSSRARNLARIIADNSGAISATNIGDGTITSTKLANGAAVSNIGYTPANLAGATFSGNVNVSGAIVATGNVTAYGTV